MNEMFKCDHCEEVFHCEVELENYKQTIGGCPKQFVWTVLILMEDEGMSSKCIEIPSFD